MAQQFCKFVSALSWAQVKILNATVAQALPALDVEDLSQYISSSDGPTVLCEGSAPASASADIHGNCDLFPPFAHAHAKSTHYLSHSYLAPNFATRFTPPYHVRC